MARRIVLGLLLLSIVPASAAADPSERKQVVDTQIRRLQEKIESARAEEGVLTSQIQAVSDRISALEGSVGRAQGELATLEDELALHQEKLDRLNELFRLQTERLDFLRAQYAAAVSRLNRRLVDIYQWEDPDAIAVLLAASSLRDLIDQLDYLNQIGSQDRGIAAEVSAAKREVREARARTRNTRASVAAVTRKIAAKTAEARAERDRLLAAQNELDAARQAKRSSLASVRHNEAEFVAESEALAQVSAQLSAQIRSAQSSAPAPESSSYSGGSPSASGFTWPVAGPVTSGFGYRWGRMHEGIDIGAGYGVPIHAAAAGTVIYAGWLGGYGNLVVIDHGGGVATAYAHQSAFASGSGQAVSQGQTIGYIGSTGHSFGPHLHFEVRVNGAPVDPLGYL